MFDRLRFSSAGESHGPFLTAILEGLPAGLSLSPEDINKQLARRQKSYGSGNRMRIEKDQVVLSSGWMNGLSTGAPLTLQVRNRDWSNWRDKDIEPMSIPRPGHVDLVAALKYGYQDLRPGLERASARETTMRVAAGACARALLQELGIHVGGYVRQIGACALDFPQAVADLSDQEAACELQARAKHALGNDLGCPLEDFEAPLRQEIKEAMKAKDTLGGVLEVFAIGCPPGLGSFVQWHQRLDARLAMAFLSIQAMKGVELGPAFDNAGRRGTEVHDQIESRGGLLTRSSNRAGGLEGGMTTGQAIVARVAMKPISTTLKPLGSVHLKTGQACQTQYERSDFCALPRAVPIAEAMLSLVLADALLATFGGDRLDDIKARYQKARRGLVSDIQIRDEPWRFGYDVSSFLKHPS